MMIFKKLIVIGLTFFAVTSAVADGLKELRVDYAAWSPLSLLVRQKGWMEEEFKNDKIEIKWILTQSGVNAMDYIKTGKVDFASSAGMPALMARASGVPNKVVYVFAIPDWAAIAVAGNSTFTRVDELKGKKVAVMPGTDPYFSLLRTLKLNGMQRSDVNIVEMNHVLGRKALEAREVDAWAALEPHLTASTFATGTRVLYRNVKFCTYGVLSTSESFIAKHPKIVKRVIKVYERARKWALENKAEVAQLMATNGNIDLNIAKVVATRFDISNPVPGKGLVTALRGATEAMQETDKNPAAPVTNKTISDLIDASFTTGIQ